MFSVIIYVLVILMILDYGSNLLMKVFAQKREMQVDDEDLDDLQDQIDETNMSLSKHIKEMWEWCATQNKSNNSWKGKINIQLEKLSNDCIKALIDLEKKVECLEGKKNTSKSCETQTDKKVDRYRIVKPLPFIPVDVEMSYDAINKEYCYGYFKIPDLLIGGSDFFERIKIKPYNEKEELSEQTKSFMEGMEYADNGGAKISEK